MTEEEKPSLINKIARILPSVEKPTYKETFNRRLMWTGIALILYLTLSHITAYGVVPASFEQFKFFEIVLGSKFGSLMTLGIGPIVTAGILLQLLTGSKIIDWDMSEPENRKKFQAWNKFLSIILCFVEAAAYVIAGAIPTSGALPIVLFVIFQLALGGLIVILLDDLVQKWGFGSGISLFIAAGVTSAILIRAFSPFADPIQIGMPAGLLWKFLMNIFYGEQFQALINLLPLIFTVVVFTIVVYAQNININIPLSFSTLRGFGRNWSLKLFYTSNIPVILAAALVANVQLMASVGLNPETNCGLLGCYDQNRQPIGGLVYYLSAPSNMIANFLVLNFIPSEMIRALTYTLFMAVTCMVFSVFWVNTSGMDSASVAEQIENIGMQIPGYRSDKRTMEGVLNRYIPALAVLGGLFIGLLAAFADFTGALGTGTGILLTVMILYQYYEQLSAENLEEAHPMVRKILE